MMDWFRQNFPAGKNYLVCQDDKEQIDSFLMDRLVTPLQQGRKHNLWGEIAEKLPSIGKKLGWLPNRIPGTFLTNTVEHEIADALAAVESQVQPVAHHIEKAAELLSRFDLCYLAQQNPLTLSQGETRLTWFLCQWVKQAEYLIIGYLPSSLSPRRVKEVIDFIHEDSRSASPDLTVILGFHNEQTGWCDELIAHKNWQVISNLPQFEKKQR